MDMRNALLATALLGLAIPVGLAEISGDARSRMRAAESLTLPSRDDGILPSALPQYRYLQVALQRYRDLAADDSIPRLPAIGERSLRVGDSYDGIQALRRLLMTVGDLHPEGDPRNAVVATYPDVVLAAINPPQPDALDAALVGALSRFQQRHGLPADGVLGPATLRALNTPMAMRVRQIERSLARWEALPRNPYRRALFVNIPQYRLFGIEDMRDPATPAIEMDVIVGKTARGQRTPTFVADMTHLVFGPYWEVPRDIAVAELLPELRADAGHAGRNGYEIVSANGRLLAPDHDGLAAVEAGSARLRQRPGAQNALGRVKFMLPNAHSVYLHDTSAPALFAKHRRAFSHGCIRLSDPAALAQYVLQDDTQWTDASIAAALAVSHSQQVNLAEPIRVYIMYATAAADADGTVQFFEDIYGMDGAGRT